jgi:NAD(P)H-hydrate repair Nnr-like enzyme with NAD(P)H-hydrate dehydratase domain
VAGVYLHGAAGDDAALRVGQESLAASDILASIPAVLRRLGGAHS